MKKHFVFVLIISSLLVSWNGLILSQASYKGELAHDGWSQVGDSSWLSDWLYRKAHNITGSIAGEQTNYPMMLSVHYDNGVDIEGEVYLGHKCKTDFGDIRFTDSTGNSLDYWMQQKIDGVYALFWVEINHIPQSPNVTTIYIYYGNSNASTISNKDWTFDLATDFEDGTIQGWLKSWHTYVAEDGVSSSAFQGNYSRKAGRTYGSAHAGNGNFYESFQNTIYLTSGSYCFEGAARFDREDSYKQPKNVKLLVDGITVGNVSYPGIQWHWLSGNFMLSMDGYIELKVEFHLYVQNLETGSEFYYIDSLFVRKWCNPEPAHGTWGIEETSYDKTPPEIVSVEWIPASPYPFIPSSTPREGEPVIVRANVSEEVEGSGIDFVELSYRVNNSGWWSTTMEFNVTCGLWTIIVPGQIGNTTIEFYITAYDKAENLAMSSVYSFNVKAIPIADLNGDGVVNMRDIGIACDNFMKDP